MMRDQAMVDRIVILCFCLVYLPTVAGILCYQCSDSTGNKGAADCQYKINRLSSERYMHEAKHKEIEKLSYLKNCSKYVDYYLTEKFQYCVITTVESFGTINAYIRDCSSPNKFPAQLNVTRLNYVRADNQTTCGFSQTQGATICVRLCDTDFCNGPSSTGNDVRSSILLIVTVLFSLFTMVDGVFH